MTTLIIDDDPFAGKLLTRQLDTLGVHDVVCFQAAQAALDFVRAAATPPGLIMCDLQMPGMDGVEVVRHLTRSGYSGGLVLISGEDQRILQTAARLANAHRLQLLGALHKPVTTEELRSILERHLAVESHPSAGAVDKSYTADDLRRAIAAGELMCHYQPKIALATGEVCGVECLARWVHPDDGLVLPDQFIPLAEESGLIDALTTAVVRLALHQARIWLEAGLVLSMAVNVSMDNLVELNFPEQVTNALEAAGVAPERLILEVTESRLMKDRLAALDVLARLRLKRIGLSIDDSGTGHSSFAQLQDVPFSELKIDRGFVNGAWRDPSRHAIFEACLRVGHDFGLKTVAEGAEDLDDWRFLRGSGCDMVQGYFVARPMPGDAVPGWVEGWSKRYLELSAVPAP